MHCLTARTTAIIKHIDPTRNRKIDRYKQLDHVIPTVSTTTAVSFQGPAYLLPLPYRTVHQHTHSTL